MPEGAAPDGRDTDRPERSAARAARVTWLGHATVVIELDGVRLITDPVLRRRVGPLVRVSPPVAHEVKAGVDAVLISHLHADHADPGSLELLGRETRVVATQGAAGWLRARGMHNVEELGAGAWTQVGPVAVCATPARHDGGGGWRPAATPAGFLVCGSASCYFAGDTDLFSGMRWLAGGIDVALLPVGGWGRKLGPGHLDPARAAVAACTVQARHAIPIHFGTLALAWPSALRPDPRSPGAQFAREVARRSSSVQPHVLAPGEALTLDDPAPRAAASS
jgi:L-ascorbate metabolism protein UlaG (beta-lactamase superfamily)